MWYMTDEDGRILATTDVEEFADGMKQFDFPEEFLNGKQDDWLIVGGKLVHSPRPKSDEEIKAEADANRRNQLNTAAAMFVRMSARSLSDEQAAEVSELFDDWAPSGRYTEGDIRRYSGELWRCRQSHEAQPSWTPNQAHSLWGRIAPPGTVEEWRQPQPGIFDGYTKGQRVTCDGFTWESDYDGLNVWRPGSIGGHWIKIG